MTQAKPDVNDVWGSGGAKADPGQSKITQGWIAEIPPHQWENFMQNRRDEFIKHVNEQGVPVWDNATEYTVDSWTKGSNGDVYISLQVSNQGKDPVSEPTWWTKASAIMQVIVGGVNGNLVTIDSTGKMIDSGIALIDILASLTPIGNWNANTNDPVLPGAATTGDFWIVSVAGATDLGGINEWAVGDWAVKTATGWAKVDNTEALTSDEIDAVKGAASPDAGNPFATMDDVSGLGSGVLSVDNLLYIEDQKGNGVSGGNSVGGTQNVRDLNTKVVDNITGASLATNQITLPAGTYKVEFSAPAVDSGNLRHKTRLRNISDSTTPIVGSSEYTDGESGGWEGDGMSTTRSVGSGLFTIAGTKVFELQTYCSAPYSDGLGLAVSSGDIEVYSQIKIWKVA